MTWLCICVYRLLWDVSRKDARVYKGESQDKNKRIGRLNFSSIAGKEIVLKSILAVIPTHALSCFQLRDGLY
ncbi:hypothetical protein H5410_020201 [Solanum commersonii]|uniref:Uncharacterized protein n=1 Tax=Solanum commersonii TaxID=4109 RepID=A0A9J5ZAI8_SOLCO|nr:hypothetical protein H5410_020201 [Solanum commersonii]